MVRTLTRVFHDAEKLDAGTELHMRDAHAFQLIHSGSAEPASRGAKKRYAEMLATHEAALAAARAEVAAKPKERSLWTIWTPGDQSPHIGSRRGLNNQKESIRV